MASLFLNFNNLEAQEYKVNTIVLDAGHGGQDVGAKGAAGSYEKLVTLQVVLLLGQKIEKAFPNVKVIYTRKTDVFIPLSERASIANRNKADLFISIHCNSTTNRTAFGTETFVLGQHKTDDQFDVAKRENSVISYEKDAENIYDGFDPNSPESSILMSLNLNAFLEQSMYFADKIQHQYTHVLNRSNRGVKQAGFVVLYRTTMPSVLTEIGFLSNPSEEKYLVSSNGQDEIAESLFQAFKEYKNSIENTKSGSVSQNINVNTAPTNTTSSTNQEVGQVPTVSNTNSSTTDKKTTSSSSVIYKIQIAVTSQLLNIKQAPYNSIKSLSFEKQNNLYKYLAGNFGNYSDAKKEMDFIRSLGFKDAFIVVYSQGVRLSANEAKLYLQ
ncbi:MAG: N-acetylmuramoyl-L-alanine amidase [Chitinophagales bacterium]|nr:N-acetylmuramoyl-L-alanine amidase [Chitinophagales bacterium]MCZ2393474.1 N-acetylmuramoyl-L-alanine amidase [Chitinophagales bacterium]